MSLVLDQLLEMPIHSHLMRKLVWVKSTLNGNIMPGWKCCSPQIVGLIVRIVLCSQKKTEYRFAEKTFSFGRVRHEVDKFSGFDHQTIMSFGLGHIFLQMDILLRHLVV